MPGLVSLVRTHAQFLLSSILLPFFPSLSSGNCECSPNFLRVVCPCVSHEQTQQERWERNGENLPDFENTREIQGIMGQASDYELRGQLSAFCDRLSQSSTELSCRRFDEERSKKSKAIDDNVVVWFFACASAHTQVPMSYEFRL